MRGPSAARILVRTLTIVLSGNAMDQWPPRCEHGEAVTAPDDVLLGIVGSPSPQRGCAAMACGASRCGCFRGWRGLIMIEIT